MSRGVGVLALGVAAGALAVAISASEVHAPSRLANGAPNRVAASAAAAPRAILLGRSVGGRAIQATELGDPAAPRKLLVVGVIHGNETAGRQVVHALSQPAPPAASTCGSSTC